MNMGSVPMGSSQRKREAIPQTFSDLYTTPNRPASSATPSIHEGTLGQENSVHEPIRFAISQFLAQQHTVYKAQSWPTRASAIRAECCCFPRRRPSALRPGGCPGGAGLVLPNNNHRLVAAGLFIAAACNPFRLVAADCGGARVDDRVNWPLHGRQYVVFTEAAHVLMTG